MSRSESRRRSAAAALSAAVLLAACGGSDDATPLGASAAAAPLLDDEGQAMPSLAADGPYAGVRVATAAQARSLEAARGGDVLHASPACCGTGDLDIAAGLVYAEQAARTLPNDTPTFVHGGSPAAARTLAERLGAAGLRSVFVVVAG